MIAALIKIILLTFIPTALLLFGLAYFRKSFKPLEAAVMLFVAFAFYCSVSVLPKFFSLPRLGNWNWEGGLLSFFWPLPIVFIFKCFTAEQMGLKLRNSSGLLYGLGCGIILGGWNIVDAYFLTEFPPATLESVFYQLLIPSFSEEMIFRGLFLAILVSYLKNEWSTKNFSFGWGIILVSILFICVHFINSDRAGHLIWKGSFNLAGNIIVATAVLAYLRLKTGSIWPGVICHGLINSLPFAAAYFIL